MILLVDEYGPRYGYVSRIGPRVAPLAGGCRGAECRRKTPRADRPAQRCRFELMQATLNTPVRNILTWRHAISRPTLAWGAEYSRRVVRNDA